MDVNVKSSFILAKEVLPYLRKRNGGRIIFMSSASAFKYSKVRTFIIILILNLIEFFY